jgi:hypothetical protein
MSGLCSRHHDTQAIDCPACMAMPASPNETIAGLKAYAEHLENRLHHATSFRYGPFIVRLVEAAGPFEPQWRIESDDGSTRVGFGGEDAQDEAIREATRRAKGVR